MSSKNQTQTQTQTQKELVVEMKELTKEMRKLKGMEFVKFYNKPWKFVWYSFVKGLMAGFGSILGATLLVALLLFVLSKISSLPIIGEYIDNIVGEIQHASPLDSGDSDNVE